MGANGLVMCEYVKGEENVGGSLRMALIRCMEASCQSERSGYGVW